MYVYKWHSFSIHIPYGIALITENASHSESIIRPTSPSNKQLTDILCPGEVLVYLFFTQSTDDLPGCLCTGQISSWKVTPLVGKSACSERPDSKFFSSPDNELYNIHLHVMCASMVASHCKWLLKRIHDQILHVCYSAKQPQVLINDMFISGNQSSSC